MIHVLGHLHPDSDSICSALVTADWLNAVGMLATPYRLGDISAETSYILRQAAVCQPELLDFSLHGKKVWLVDFTDMEQGPSSLPDSNIVGIIDHHRLGTVTTQEPPDIWVRSVGCCATVIWQICNIESHLALSWSQATLLLGAIVSDTVGLTSPTTTAQDIAAVKFLSVVSQLNYEHFVRGVLTAKTDIHGYTPEQLLMKDAKRYQIQGLSVLISQIEVAAMSAIDIVLPELLIALEKEKQENNIDIAMLVVTDIYKKTSSLYFSEDNVIPLKNFTLPGAVSRKKEILPWLTATLSKAIR